MDQPAMHVAERVLVRHQLDVPLAAKGIERKYLVAGHRRCIGPHLRMLAVGESVLSIELELIQFPPGQHIDQLEEGLHPRHLVAANVEQEPAHRKIRPVGDAQGR